MKMKNRAVLLLILSIACTSPVFQQATLPPTTAPLPIIPSSSPPAVQAGSSGGITALLNASPLPNGGLFTLGDPIRIRVSQRPGWVRYILTDAYSPVDWTINGEIFEGEGWVQADGSGAWLYLPTDRVTRYGLYRLDVFTDQGNLTDLRIGLVDPIVRLGPYHNPSPIGFIAAVDPYPGFAEQIAHLGIKWVHFDIPVNTDADILSALDPPIQTFVDQALASDVTPIFKLIGGAPPGAADYNSPFYQNLRQVAQAYRDRVHHWIVGNEIDGCGWWNPCDWELYVTFLRGIAQVVRGVDPQARILAADLYQGDSTVLRRMLEEERRDPSFTLFDVLSVHYLEEGNGEGLSPDGCCGSINTYRRVLQEYGLSKPIWNTEALSPLRGGIHWNPNESSYFRGGQSSLSPAKTVIGNLAVGAEKIFFFSYNYDQPLLDPSGGTFENPARTLSERALAVRALADQIQTATYYGRLNGAPSFVEGHFFKNGSETILVIWSNEGNRDIEAVMTGMNGPVTLFDPLGNAYPLREINGKVKFRVHYEPQYLRGFTNMPTLTFEDTENDAPYFVSTPITSAVVGRAYYYNAEAYDSEPTGQPNALIPVTYELQQAPGGMQINPDTGVITWTPSESGRFPVRIRVRDSQGASTTQSFEISVSGNTQNAPPSITSRPRTIFGVVGMPFAYNVNAVDPEGDAMNYQLTQSPPWLSIDPISGFIYGIPSEPGTFPVTIRAIDARGGWAEQAFSIQVASGDASSPPVIAEGPSAIPFATVATVRWRTLQAADSRVRYGRTCGSWEQTIVRSEWVYEHSVGITGLQPNTSYCYEVQSVNTGGASEWRRGSFTTLSREFQIHLPLIRR